MLLFNFFVLFMLFLVVLYLQCKRREKQTVVLRIIIGILTFTEKNVEYY